MKVAISQPTLLPWMGYIAMMDHVDEFVFLDHVPINKRSWQTRNRIKTPQGAQWVSVPVSASQGQSLDSVRINGRVDKIARSIEQNYLSSPYYFQYGRMVRNIFDMDHKYLLSLNYRLLDYFIQVFGIKTKFHCSSQMNVEGSKADLLVNICEKLGATEYISAPGSKEYMEESGAFERTGIPVQYFNYKHPVYKQQYGDFIPYMSVIDFLFNEGPNLEIVRRGYEVSGDTGAGWIEENPEEEYKEFPRQTDNLVHDRSCSTL